MLNPDDHCPTNLDDAIALIFDNLEPQEIEFIKTNGAQCVHHTFGMAIRNAWLWNVEHPLNQHFRERFALGHADDMSGMILSGVEACVKGQVEWDPKIEAERYRTFWLTQDIDPLTLEEHAAK